MQLRALDDGAFMKRPPGFISARIARCPDSAVGSLQVFKRTGVTGI